jgi:hypothetical protein
VSAELFAREGATVWAIDISAIGPPSSAWDPVKVTRARSQSRAHKSVLLPQGSDSGWWDLCRSHRWAVRGYVSNMLVEIEDAPHWHPFLIRLRVRQPALELVHCRLPAIKNFGHCRTSGFARKILHRFRNHKEPVAGAPNLH